MPPKAVRTVRDLIYWQYAKLIAESAGYGKTKNYGFIMDRFKQLKNEDIQWSGSIREYVKEREKRNECIYCGSKEPLSTDHLIPKSRGGPDTGDNAITACKRCNSSKGDRGVYEWYGLERRNELPRIVEGKYLKLLYSLHEKEGTLDVDIKDLDKLCKICDLGDLCEETSLTVYCLESILKK
ncbi:MAG: HNH endonuclease [Candidatus Methanoperedens sp.]|nr:HNH endonuclease [Candidatus Methanoperedens sp.]